MRSFETVNLKGSGQRSGLIGRAIVDGVAHFLFADHEKDNSDGHENHGDHTDEGCDKHPAGSLRRALKI